MTVTHSAAKAGSMTATTTMTVTATTSSAETVIERRSGWRALDLRELWRYRELLYFFTWRDVKVKYKQTMLGVVWAVLQPVATMAIFAVVFGRLVGLSQYSGDIPYPVFVFAGLIPWGLFAASMNSAGNSLIAEGHIITKIYFPRLIIPIASIGAALVDFAISSIILIVVMLASGIVPGVEVFLLPVFLVLLLLSSLSIGIAIASLNVAYRDFKYMVPFAIQCLFYLTPVIYPASLVPQRFRWLSHLNPMATVVDGFRYCLFGTPVDWSMTAASSAVAVTTFVASILYFRRVEATFADII